MVLEFKREQAEPFDVITGQRILINLPSHGDQMDALRNLRKFISPNGSLILTEATKQGHERTDLFRSRFGLPMLENYGIITT
jgi:2-polyprenyl-3-methyl-5-hydroxy-6-metoxy-1,4-benzoquinol methylase